MENEHLCKCKDTDRDAGDDLSNNGMFQQSGTRTALCFRKNAIENVKSMYDSNQSNLELYGLTLKNGQNKYR